MPTFLSNDQYAKFDGANFLDEVKSKFSDALNGVQQAVQTTVDTVLPQTPAEPQTPLQQPVSASGVGPAPSTDSDFLSGLHADFSAKLTNAAPTPSDSLTNPLGTGNAPQPSGNPLPPLNPSTANLTPPANDTVDYIRKAAAARNIDPDTAVKVAQSEGLNSYIGDNNSSFGPFQLHYGNVASGGNAVSGLGDAFTKATGLDARDPSTVHAQIDFALDQAKAGGWGPWHGAARVGIGEKEGIGTAPTQASTSDKPGVSVPNQFGLGLSQADAAAFCGPVAAMALAAKYGNNIPADAVRQAAVDSGWTSAGGMNGVANEQKLLTKLNIPTKLETNVNWSNVQRDATSGNPVIISTAGHYFVVDGYDAKTGAYHVGQSGLALKNGTDWMTQSQMSAASQRLSGDGSINGALYVDNPQSPVASVAAPAQAPQDFLGGLRDRFTSALDSLTPALNSITSNPQTQDITNKAMHGGLQATDLPEAAGVANNAADTLSTAVNPARDVPVLGGVINSTLNPLQGGPLGTLTAGADVAKLGKFVAGKAPDLASAGLGLVDKLIPPEVAHAATNAPAAATTGDKIIDDTLGMFAKQDKGGLTLPNPSDVSSWVEENLADKFAPINRLGPKSEQAAANFQGRTAAAVQRAKTEMAPVLKIAGDDLPALNVYRKLQVDLERANAAGGSRLASAGVKTAQDAQDGLTALEQRLGPDRWAKVQQADQLLQSSLNNLLDDKVASGLVKPELADQLKTMYPHYNPVRVLEAVENGTLQGTGRKLTQNSNTLKRLTEYGSEGDTEAPVRSAIRALVEGDVAVQRNNVARQIAGDVLQQGLGKKAATTTLRTGPQVDPVKGLIPLATSGQKATVVLKKIGDVPGTISYYNKGVRQLVTVPDDLERAVKALDDDSLGKAGRILSALNAPLRKGATTLNPTFIPTNMASDAVTTFVREGWDAFKRIPKGYYHALTKDQTYQDFIRAGGGMESYFNHSPRDVEKAIQQAQGTIVRSKGDWAKYIAQQANPLHHIETLGGAAELGPRIATFQSRLAKGQTAGQAALAGRRVTVDFARSGSLAKSVNSAVPFLNAQIQGTLNVVRTLRDIPSAKARFALLAGVASSTFAWNQQFPKEYADIPDYVKDQYMVIILGHGEPDPSGVGFKSIPYVAIPLREWSAPSALINHALAQTNNSDPRGMGDFLKSMATSYAPSNATSSVGLAGSLSPAPARYLAENALNTRFYSGAPIVSSQFENTPPTEQYDEHTGGIAKAIAQKLGWSPKGLDFLLSENLGGVGRIAGGTVTPPLVRSAGGQTLQSMYTAYDQKVSATEGKLADLVSASPQYQKATRDRQIQLQQTANLALRSAIKDQLGIPATARDTGLPNHYLGVSDKTQEAKIDQARAAYHSWKADPRHVQRPTAAQMVLAIRYDQRVSPLYTRDTKLQSQSNADTKRLVSKVAPAP